MFLHAPKKQADYPLDLVGYTKPYSMQSNTLVADTELDEVFGPQLNGQYAPARIEDVDALISSFGRFATRSYDRLFVQSVIESVVRVTAATTPPVSAPVLDPYQVVGLILGNKAAGFHCLGSKYNFIKAYIWYLYPSLEHEYILMQAVPLYVLIPKEEIRDVAKAPRDLAFPPTWFVLLTVKYEKVFFMDTLNNWIQSPIKVGIPLPQCWFLIYYWLTQYARSGFTTEFFMWDASQFDRSHQLEVTLAWHDLMRLKKAMAEVYIHEKSHVLDYILFWSCVRLVALPDGRIVLVIAGIYSGDISTTNKNSYNHIMRLAICWHYRFGSLKGFRTFVKLSGLCLFGDDAVCSAHTPQHFDFLANLASVWQTTSGANLVVSHSKHFSKVSFLGRRALGDTLPHAIIPVTSDMPRLISSLVFKNKPGRTAITRLSKLIACRQLLCGFSFGQGHCTNGTQEANQLGLENLNSLDLVIRRHIAIYDSQFRGHPEWQSLVFMGTMEQEVLLASLLCRTDVPLGQ